MRPHHALVPRSVGLTLSYLYVGPCGCRLKGIAEEWRAALFFNSRLARNCEATASIDILFSVKTVPHFRNTNMFEMIKNNSGAESQSNLNSEWKKRRAHWLQDSWLRFIREFSLVIKGYLKSRVTRYDIRLTLNDFHSSWTSSKNETALAAAMQPNRQTMSSFMFLKKKYNVKWELNVFN